MKSPSNRLASPFLTLAVSTLAILVLSASSAFATVRYVRSDISPGGNGLSWSTAYKTVQDALTASGSGTGVTEIWIKVGTYVPSVETITGDPRSVTFTMNNGVSLYGGFAGTETSLGQRDPDARSTLSGVLTGGSRAYHIVTASSNVSSAVRLDQLVIVGANNDLTSGGIYTNGGGVLSNAANLILSNSRVAFNDGAAQGGGVWAYDGALVIEHCVIDLNGAPNGGGIHVAHMSALAITDSEFIRNNNSSGVGGVPAVGSGMELLEIDSVTIANCLFEANTAYTGLGGAARINQCDVTMSGCQIVGSDAANGGGLYITETTVQISDCLFWGNRAYGGGGGAGGAISIYGQGSSLDIDDCQFWENSAGVVEMTEDHECHYDGSGGAIASFAIPANIRNTYFGQGNGKAGNGASGPGGAIWGALGEVTNCVFEWNISWKKGGAIACESVGSNRTVFKNCTFHHNLAVGIADESDCRGGGAVFMPSTPKGVEYLFVNCRFDENVAGDLTSSGNVPENNAPGGALCAAGAVVRIQNCSFDHNEGTGGGGAMFAGGSGISVAMDSSTVAINHSKRCGAGLAGNGYTVQNAIVWGNTADGTCTGETQLSGSGTLNKSCLQQVGGQDPSSWTLSNVIASDPLFKSTSAPTNLRLRICSPCIDSADDSLLPADELDLDNDSNTTEAIPIDLAGVPRLRNGRLDMGAYECCPADMDSSGTLTGNDYQAFYDAWVGGDPAANFDCSTGSPLLTGNDFQAFIDAYVNGCS